MPRLHQPLDDWTLSDLEALIAERIPEGQRLEYKQALPLDRESDRRELCKDISGMANADGGLLVYGVAEDDSEEPRPVDLSPLPEAGLQTRLEDVVDSAVSPRLDYRSRPLPVADGGLVLLVHVRRRIGGPHMVEGYGARRYYARRGTRTVPMTEDEVRCAYVEARDHEDRALARLAGLPLMPRVHRTRAEDKLSMGFEAFQKEPDWLPWVSVLAVPLDGPDEMLSPAMTRPEAFPEDHAVRLGHEPIRQGRFTVDAHGLVEESALDGRDTATEAPTPADPAELAHRLRIYRSGVIEWGGRYRQEDGYAIPSFSFALAVRNVLGYAGSVYEQLGYHGRLVVLTRIDNVDHAQLILTGDGPDAVTPVRGGVEWVQAPAHTTVGDLLDDPMPLTRDAMDRVWQAFGYSSCRLFTNAGEWRRQP